MEVVCLCATSDDSCDSVTLALTLTSGQSRNGKVETGSTSKDNEKSDYNTKRVYVVMQAATTDIEKPAYTV